MKKNQEVITAAQFHKKVGVNGVTVVKFGAAWCGPCRAYDSDINELTQEFSGRVSFYAIDIDDLDNNSGNVAARDMKLLVGPINNIPHIAIVRNGTVLATIIGHAIPKLRQKLVAALKGDSAPDKPIV